MSLLETFLGDSAINIVKKYIKKLFVHEAEKYRCSPSDLKIIINHEIDGSISIMTYYIPDNVVWRIIPDNEVEKILMK